MRALVESLQKRLAPDLPAAKGNVQEGECTLNNHCLNSTWTCLRGAKRPPIGVHETRPAATVLLIVSNVRKSDRSETARRVFAANVTDFNAKPLERETVVSKFRVGFSCFVDVFPAVK